MPDKNASLKDRRELVAAFVAERELGSYISMQVYYSNLDINVGNQRKTSKEPSGEVQEDFWCRRHDIFSKGPCCQEALPVGRAVAHIGGTVCKEKGVIRRSPRRELR